MAAGGRGSGQDLYETGSAVNGLHDQTLQRAFEQAVDRLSESVTVELGQLTVVALRTAQAANRRRFVGRMAELMIAADGTWARGDDAARAELQARLRGVELGMEAAGFQPWDVARASREARVLLDRRVSSIRPVEAVR